MSTFESQSRQLTPGQLSIAGRSRGGFSAGEEAEVGFVVGIQNLIASALNRGAIAFGLEGPRPVAVAAPPRLAAPPTGAGAASPGPLQTAARELEITGIPSLEQMEAIVNRSLLGTGRVRAESFPVFAERLGADVEALGEAPVSIGAVTPIEPVTVPLIATPTGSPATGPTVFDQPPTRGGDPVSLIASIGRILQVPAVRQGAAIAVGGILGEAIGSAIGGTPAIRAVPTVAGPGGVPMIGATSVGRIPSAGAGTRRMSAMRFRSFARQVGLENAAAAMGISLVEAAQIIARAPRRRRRGITAAQLATTRSTIRRVVSIAKSLDDCKRITVRKAKC